MHIRCFNNVIGILSQRVIDANRLSETQVRLIQQLQNNLDDQNPDVDDDDFEDESDD
jgi:hypothetical protein